MTDHLSTPAGTRDASTARSVPARLDRHLGTLVASDDGRHWHGRLAVGAVAPLLAVAVGGGTAALETDGATERVRVRAVWFDAEWGQVECELEGPAALGDAGGRLDRS